ncbi:ABC-type metal ion transport system [Fructobacillus tropaeoli]|uniref:MetQ/NlpA family ABC transporter substrate-binding protein n=1 Tax=Fructobacillus tropaeoli TaxID=709323 RepID=UPI002D938BFD|nr:ABC-type metal ion transport system [Fructobacillus tropaeoli]
MSRKSKFITSFVILILALLAAFSFFHASAQGKSSKNITVGAVGSDAKAWQYIAKSDAAKKAGLKITVKTFTDGVSLNQATADGTIDVNAFQSYAYYVAYNQTHKSSKLAVLGNTYLEPMGIYSGQYHKLSELPDGATIAIPNDPANTSRALKLLASVNLITLKSGFGSLSGTNEIKDNPHNFKFKEIDSKTGPRVEKDSNIGAVLIGNTDALEGGLNVLKDSLAHEKIDQTTKDNINILATANKNKDNSDYKKLVALYHDKDVQAYIKKAFDGTKVEVNKPVSYLTD